MQIDGILTHFEINIIKGDSIKSLLFLFHSKWGNNYIIALICFALLITTMFKSDKVRFVLGFIIALCCVLLFNYISEHYVLFSKTVEVMMN